MEAEMVPSLSPLLQGADEWGEVLLLLPLLVALEAVLSADNAIALAAISRRLHDPERQRQALNLGLLLALVLRMALILAARWVLDAWPLQLAAAAYLLWLCGSHLLGLDAENDDRPEDGSPEDGTSIDSHGQADVGSLAGVSDPTAESALTAVPTGLSAPDAGRTSSSPQPVAAQAPLGMHDGHGSQQGRSGATLASIALTLALTDLAFSLDSVAAAVAVTDRLALVMAGGLLGVLALRLTAGLFVRWLELFSRLETAGYLAVGLVGIRLLVRLLFPELEVPEWVLLLLVAALFLWGFSRRSLSAAPVDALASELSARPGTAVEDTGEADRQAGSGSVEAALPSDPNEPRAAADAVASPDGPQMAPSTGVDPAAAAALPASGCVEPGSLDAAPPQRPLP